MYVNHETGALVQLVEQTEEHLVIFRDLAGAVDRTAICSAAEFFAAHREATKPELRTSSAAPRLGPKAGRAARAAGGNRKGQKPKPGRAGAPPSPPISSGGEGGEGAAESAGDAPPANVNDQGA